MAEYVAITIIPELHHFSRFELMQQSLQLRLFNWLSGYSRQRLQAPQLLSH